MTLEELRRKWEGWVFEIYHTVSRPGVGILAHAMYAGTVPYIAGILGTTESEVCDSLDAWMTKHIKRPKSRKAAGGAKKGGAG